MSIIKILEGEFHSYNLDKNHAIQFFLKEIKWFRNENHNLLGTIVYDISDNDWGYMILAKENDDVYRAFDFKHSLLEEEATSLLKINMSVLSEADKIEEKLFETDLIKVEANKIVLTDIDLEIKKYFKKNPEKLYEISPRTFEQLVASILEDFGFDVELTKATRDGGSDIIAHIRNSITSFLLLVECKKYSPENKVDVGIIREVAGIHTIRKPSKSLIVTTSFFTKDAMKEASLLKEDLELKDYNSLKKWLNRY